MTQIVRALTAISALTALAAGVWITGCDVDRGYQGLRHVEPSSSSPAPGVDRPAEEPADGEAIRIASYNIQVFGQAKLGKPHVMEILAQVVRRFDIVAIQEIRSAQQDVLPRFVELINSTGAQYDFVIGPRLGRTSSKEQYAYVFDTTRIELVPGSVYTVDDPDDRLHRPPLVASFRVRGPPSEQPFTFTLINIHTDPDETATELDALADVFQAVRQNDPHEDDVILLGDLNESEHRLRALGSLPNIEWAISGMTTNTRSNAAYDNILFDRTATTEYTGRSGVLNVLREFNLSLDEALEVSDHFPVWAEFRAVEDVRGRLAGGERGPAR